MNGGSVSLNESSVSVTENEKKSFSRGLSERFSAQFFATITSSDLEFLNGVQPAEKVAKISLVEAHALSRCRKIERNK